MISKTAVLLVNLGTPSALTKRAVKSYLREFLLDPRVIDLPWPFRYLLVNTVIVPFRSGNTLEAYSSVWTKDGSPLFINSLLLQQKLELNLNSKIQLNEQDQSVDVFLAMRYGQPSIQSVLTQIQQNNYTRIIIVPLYPQYASASTGSVLEKSLKHVSDFGYFPKIICLNEFYLNSGYIKSVAHSLAPYLEKARIQYNNSTIKHHVLFSYHGIPKRQLALQKNSKFKACDDNKPCPANYPAGCYRAQCYATTRAVAKQLELPNCNYTTAFQSRLGKLPWIKPYSDEVLNNLRQKNIEHLIVICPSFVADCLETIEEIGMRLKEDWLELGGKSFELVPCLNDNDDWVDALGDMVMENIV